MNEPLQAPPPPQSKEDPETLVLRGSPRPAVRFRRGLIVGTTGALAAALVTLSWLALQPPNFRKVATMAETDEPGRKGGADALADVPGSYGDVPRLGPPLPGDLGRPILEQQRGVPDPLVPAPADTAGAAAREAALSSPLIVQLGTGAAPALVPEPAPGAAPREEATSASAAIPASAQAKIEFARPAGEGDVNPHQISAARSPWTLSAGTVIPASLITGLNSDLPGTVLAQVTENVRDSATGRAILIPQGARVIGSYDCAVGHGQRRALLVWTRIVLPDGSSIRLDNMQATEGSGYAGLHDQVDTHTWPLLKGIALSTMLGVGTQLSLGGGGSDLVRAIRESTQQNAAHAGDQITSRNLNVQPTIRVRPGWPVRILLNKDLVLQPWRG
ncbi:TrbI/VirB10 family protein [Sphingomonas sp. URHD0057]|uniref:TrbI/VirB10 family protein n=1 Tax=Sphingomonas sp. URHD0057 TaxID=1380389 RepID=UPI0004908E39|nr:TrbI/VirB10 family protein [Sphingomonas sp. URHD0057]